MTLRTVQNDRLVDWAKLDNISVTQPVDLDVMESEIATNTGDIATHIADVANPHSVTKAQVGLGDTDNTSDANKPVSTATQNALDLKADDSAVVHNTGNETVAGIKTFSSSPIVPTPTTDMQSATKKYVDDNAGGISDAPSDGNTYGRKNAAWQQTPSGSGTTSGTNTGDQFTSTTASKLLGRWSASGAGAAEEIILGTNLSMSWTTLNATGGSGSGDVTWPATNTDNYIPQWNGANSKTLKDGLAVPAGGLAGLTEVGTKMNKFTVTSLKTGNYTAAVDEYVPCDIFSSSFTITLPTAPADKSQIELLIVKTAADRVLTIQAGGTDKFDRTDWPQTIYMYLAVESLVCTYQTSTGLWFLQSAAAPFNFATGFPGIDSMTPITNADISIDTSTLVLTINPSRGYFDFFVDGGGKITRLRKNGAVNFPAFTDTSGTWFFYFNSSGTAVTTQTPWTTSDFSTIATVYRIIWNSSLSGANKLVDQYIEYHLNDISADDHQWYHLQGTQWIKGGTMVNNAIVSGSPNADGRNSVIGLTTISNVDDNLEYTVTNSTGWAAWQQDLGNTTAASLNATNSALFKVFTQDSSARVSFLSATRFPFDWDSGTNIPQYITSTGVRTAVTANYYFVYFVYATQNPLTGEAIKVVSATSDFSNITNARAFVWTDIQNAYSIIGNDKEIRPLYRLIFEYKTSYDAGAKYAALRETQDLRTATVTSTIVASGSIPATSVTVVPAGNIASTNVQSALEELDAEKAILAGSVTQSFSASTLELWHASDTTLSRVSAGVAAIEGIPIVVASSTTVWQVPTITGSNTYSWQTPSAGGAVWTAVTNDANMAINNGYIANKGTLLTMTLPTTAAVGTELSMAGMNAGLWKIAQNASQNIKFGNQTTTTGTGGSLASVLTYDCVNLVCVVANTTWVVTSSVGNITIV